METQICTKCNLELVLSDNFYKHETNLSGYGKTCKSCVLKTYKNRRVSNRKEVVVSDLEGEVWEVIENYPLYYVSNKGRVKSDFYNIPNKNGVLSRSLKSILKPNDNNRGYHSVSIRNENGIKNATIHRLVAIAFIPNPENKREVNHRDGNKLNNCVDNLEWVTPSENSQHAFDTGLSKPTYYVTNPNGISKVLCEDDIPNIRNLYPSLSYKKISKIYNVASNTIRAVITGKTWSQIS